MDLTEKRLQHDLNSSKALGTLKNDIATMTQELDEMLIGKTPSERISEMFDAYDRRAKQSAEVAAKIPEAIVEGLAPTELHRLGNALDEMLLDLQPKTPMPTTTKGLQPRQNLGIVERGTREGFMHATGRGGKDTATRIAKASEKTNEKLDKLIGVVGQRGHGFQGDINVNTHHIA